MKTSLHKIWWMGMTSLLLWSCKKDETQVRINTAAPELTATATTLVLNQAEANSTAVTFNWNAVDYGFSDAINYVLQFSKAGTSFASASTTEVVVNKADLKKSLTVSDLNKELNKILSPGSASEVEVRLKSDAGNIYSNVVKMTVTPYRDLILYSWPQAINVAGNYQGWDPKVAPQIVALTKTNDKYTKFNGFIDFTDPAPTFKLVKGDDWSAGDFGSAGPDKLENGGDNLTLAEAGTYLVQADIEALTWSAYKINGWGLIGDAVPTTGWNSDQDMTYDAATKTWRITLDLVKGAIKFRANDDWAVNFGDKGNDGKPELGVDDNIPIADPGNYTIVLDVSVAGNYIYSIKKN